MSWVELLNNTKQYQKFLCSEPIFLICTNEQHDPCCGKLGLELFQSQDNTNNIWQCSHLGGDRFAGNVVVLPQGNYYRRVGPESFSQIVKAENNNLIAIDHFAGLSCYNRIIQFAQCYLLKYLQAFDFKQIKFIDQQELEPFHFLILFEYHNTQKFKVRLTQINTGIENFFSCHATTKSEIVCFQLQSV